MAEELLSQSGSVQDLAQLTPSEIRKTKGMGLANTAAVAAALELSRRLNYPALQEKTYLRSVDDVAAHFRQQYATGPPEKFVALFINRNHLLLGQLEVSRGGSNAAVVNPQRIFREALLHNAKAVILVHNHPGGDIQPSQQDITLTKELREAGRIFRTPISDHIIVVDDECFSLSEKGLL